MLKDKIYQILSMLEHFLSYFSKIYEEWGKRGNHCIMDRYRVNCNHVTTSGFISGIET